MADYFTTARKWNVLHGCQRSSPGCQHCWAERMATRHRNASTSGGRWTGDVVLFRERLEQPLHWRKPGMVAVQFMGDLFYEGVPFEFIAAVYGVMAECPQHTFLLLTKRPEQLLEFYSWLEQEAPSYSATTRDVCEIKAQRTLKRVVETGDDTWPLPNVWIGVSAEDQQTLDERWTLLARIPAARLWLSLEPLLGPVQLHCLFSAAHSLDDPPLDLVVVGCESGPGRRPCKREWIRSIIDQCRAAGTPVHVKQVSLNGWVSHDMSEWPEDLRRREFPNVHR